MSWRARAAILLLASALALCVAFVLVLSHGENRDCTIRSLVIEEEEMPAGWRRELDVLPFVFSAGDDHLADEVYQRILDRKSVV